MLRLEWLVVVVMALGPWMCASQQASPYWTQWYNRDLPSGNCDCEELFYLTGQFPNGFKVVCGENTVIAAQCRVATPTHSAYNRIFTSPAPAWVPNNLRHDCTTAGLSCYSVDQTTGDKERSCADYEIRYRCGDLKPKNPRCSRVGTTSDQVNSQGVCTFWGDPHYTSFDGKRFDYQGNCKYVMAEDCLNGSFSIQVEQELTNPTSSVAVSKAFTIRDSGKYYHLRRNQQFFVGQSTTPTATPYSDAYVNVTKSGPSITIVLANSTVKLTWSSNHQATVTADESWYNRLCGLCGPNNGTMADDFTGRNGSVFPTAESFGDSWIVQSGLPDACAMTTTGGDPCAKLSAEGNATAYNVCSSLGDREFKNCTDAMSIETFKSICTTEVCDCGPANPLCLCTTLEALARTCGEAGLGMGDGWRDTYGCDGFCVFGSKVYADDAKWKDGKKNCECDDGVVNCKAPPTSPATTPPTVSGETIIPCVVTILVALVGSALL